MSGILKLHISPLRIPAGAFDLPGKELADRAAENAAQQVRELFMDNFTRRGGKSFWLQAADSVQTEGEGGGHWAVCVYQRGVRLQWLGKKDPGVLPGATASTHTGAPTKYISIPGPANGGRKAANAFGKMYFQPVKKAGRLAGLLFPAEEGTAKRKRKDQPAGRVVLKKAGNKPLFYLLTETIHQPHPDVIPTLDAINRTAESAMRETLNNHLNH